MAFLYRILEPPAVYSTWQAPFVARKFAPVARRIRRREVGRVLDVGCGPGTNAAQLNAADSVGVDIAYTVSGLWRMVYFQGRTRCASQ